ncbi:hypothetical protein HDV00_009491 [Rhizophlyctis rosea]|nr:hypothetical protein HDV00_009491 [Rhizophlyctis rosea]
MSTAAPTTIKLAVLDDYTSTSYSHLKALASFPIQIDHLSPSNDHLTPEALIALLQPYTIISTMRERTRFPRQVLENLPNLKLLLTTGLRNASIDSAAAEENGIIVAGTNGRQIARDGRSYDATNEQTWALILGVARGVSVLDGNVKRNGGWQDEEGGKVGVGLATGLAGKTLGLVGLGRLGIQAAITGRLGFGMDIIAWSENLIQERADEEARKRGLPERTFKVVSKEELFRTADVVSVHYVLSERSRGIVGRTDLGWLKPSAIIVNTSRGPLIDEEALLEAVREKRIKGVGLDVYGVEPLPKDSPWRSEEFGGRVVLSPHMGYVTEETINGWYKQTAENIARFLNGQQVENVITAAI